MFGVLRRRRRSRLLASPFPSEWRSMLERNCALWGAVPSAERTRLENDVRFLMAERTWEPCGGLQLNDSMRALIAAQACVLTLGHTVDAFDHVRSILVYPEAYFAPDLREDEAGVITESVDEREGEAWERGIVVLSWSDLERDARTLDGRNLVLHEMAHQIDLADSLGDSAAGFSRRSEEASTRLDTFLDLFEDFAAEIERGQSGLGLDPYGALDEAEFFSVATESFFERGVWLQQRSPDLYGILAWYYNIDPAGW